MFGDGFPAETVDINSVEFRVRRHRGTLKTSQVPGYSQQGGDSLIFIAQGSDAVERCHLHVAHRRIQQFGQRWNGPVGAQERLMISSLQLKEINNKFNGSMTFVKQLDSIRCTLHELVNMADTEI